MANLLEKMKYIVGLEDVEENEDYDYGLESEKTSEDENKMVSKANKNDKRKENVVNLHANSNMDTRILVYEPKTYNEVTSVVGELKDNKVVILNMLGLENELKSNVFHCLSGAIYALNGSMQKVAKDIFVLAPSNVEVDSNQISEEMKSGIVFPWQK